MLLDQQEEKKRPEHRRRLTRFSRVRRGEDGLGIAFVGASMRATILLQCLSRFGRRVHLAGIYDRLASKSQYVAGRYGSPETTVYRSLDEVVADPRVDVVMVTTPDNEHVAPVQAALAAGKHVYCEKPMATTLAHCDAIMSASRHSRKVAYMGMNLRHSPLYHKIHELVTQGKIGKILTIEANEYYFEGRSYFRRWNRCVEYSGGLWITKACHDFDLLNWISGGKPRRVFASCDLSYYRRKRDGGTHCRVCPIRKRCPDAYDIANPPNREWDELGQLTEEATGTPRDVCLYNSKKDTFDNGMAMVEYDNGVRASYTLNVVASRTTRQMRIQGTGGAIEADLEDGLITVWARYSGKKTVYDVSKKMKSSHGGADVEILSDFLRCCVTGDSPRSNWVDGRRSVQVGLAARRSCETGKVVVL